MNFWTITAACVAFAISIIVFVIGTRFEDEDIGPVKDTYHKEDSDANS